MTEFEKAVELVCKSATEQPFFANDGEYEAVKAAVSLVRQHVGGEGERWKRFGNDQPKPGQRVLICQPTFGDERDFVRSATFSAPNRWHCDHASIPAGDDNIWMPLPEPPRPVQGGK